MKKMILALLFVLLCVASVLAQSIGIGNTAPNSSAALEIKSTTKGLLIPRTSTAGRTAIANPAKGLMVYDTTAGSFWYHNGSAWVQIGAGTSGWGLTGNAATNANTNFIGTTDTKPLVIKVNNKKAGYIDYDTTIGNTSLGYKALAHNTTGTNNTVAGYSALQKNTEGNSNTAIGYNTMRFNTYGSFNVAVGDEALDSNVSGAFNTVTGHGAGFSNKSGMFNTVSGYGAFYYNTTGMGNTAIGYSALPSNIFGDNNTVVGSAADAIVVSFPFAPNSSATNATAIGHEAMAYESNMVRLGNNAVKSIGGSVDWSTISDGRLKKNIRQNVPGLDFILRLQPVTYNLDLDAADSITGRYATKNSGAQQRTRTPEAALSRKQKEAICYTGFIAQDVEKLAKSINYNFSGVDAATQAGGLYGLRYASFVPGMVKAIQEQQAIIEKLDKNILALQKENEKLKSMQADIEKLKAALLKPL
jgi:hypothetical protein